MLLIDNVCFSLNTANQVAIEQTQFPNEKDAKNGRLDYSYQ